MDTTARGVRGVMHIAYLDTSVSDTCPSNLTKYEVDGTTMCGRHNSTLSTQPCNSVYYPSEGVEYSHICGRAVGYAYSGSGSGFYTCGFWWPQGRDNINALYDSGITIVKGPSNDRRHIWTYAAGRQEVPGVDCNCPCAPTDGVDPPSFVGNNYFCESATKYQPPAEGQWFTNYTMWQGNCYEGSNCCPDDGRPWFNVDLDNPTNEDVEVRWCGSKTNDNIATELLEIFVY